MKEVRVEQEEKGKEKEAEEIKLQKLQGAKNEAYHKCTVAVGEAKAVNTPGESEQRGDEDHNAEELKDEDATTRRKRPGRQARRTPCCRGR